MRAAYSFSLRSSSRSRHSPGTIHTKSHQGIRRMTTRRSGSLSGQASPKIRRVVRETPIESGYAMPKSFAEAPRSFTRTDATDTPFNSGRGARRLDHRAGRGPAPAVRAAPARDGALDAHDRAPCRRQRPAGRPGASRGDPREPLQSACAQRQNLGLMQIKHATARGVGYAGSAAGLFDAETNLTFTVRYLAGAYRAAGGNHSRAVATMPAAITAAASRVRRP